MCGYDFHLDVAGRETATPRHRLDGGAVARSRRTGCGVPQVDAGERFAVLVQIRTPKSQYPIAVEFASSELGDAVTLEDGEGYISADGGWVWERVETAQDSNLCLKVYADREETR